MSFKTTHNRPIPRLVWLLVIAHLHTTGSAQTGDSELDLSPYSVLNYRSNMPRELKVINQTLSPEEIDPAVLNRLLQEAIKTPERIQQSIKVDASQLASIVITLSNAKTYINSNELTAIRAMCDEFHGSRKDGDGRILAALDAYETRSDFTKKFIQRFYTTVLEEIESSLDEQALVSFQRYMNDRRRRMSTAGNITAAIPTQNLISGAEAVDFHCGPPRRRDNP
ncbi:MAG: hypothetical protein AB8B95_15730 [Pseudohongiellaceae bacterium]